MTDKTIPNFWNGDHNLNASSVQLTEKLMPSEGNADTLQGELIRASMRISYDWFNNGWGCNNWSGAVCFLEKKFSELPVQPEAATVKDLMKELAYVKDYSHGERPPMNDYRADVAVTRIHEIVISTIMVNPTLIENKMDMFELQERDYREPEEDEDDEGDGWN